MTLRVLHVIDSLGTGGAEASLLDLAPWLRRDGVEVEVAYLREREGLRSAFDEAGVPLWDAGGPGGRGRAVRRLVDLVRERRPALVHTTLFEADVCGRVAARWARTPVVSTLANVAYGPEQRAQPRVRPWRSRGAQLADAATARLVTRFHALTQAVAETMARRLRIPPGKIDVIPRGRDPERLGRRTGGRRDAARAALGCGPDQPVVLAAARHEWQKGLDVLLAALPAVRREIPEVALLVAGRSGNETPRLEALRAGSGLVEVVRFLGPRDDVADLLCAADVCVVPSRWEGFGGVVVEAMALECPLVASSVPAVEEVVGDPAAALLVPREDSAALAGAIVATLGDTSAARARVAEGRRRFESGYTIEAVARRTAAWYRSIRPGQGLGPGGS